MGRPFIEFIQSQALPWSETAYWPYGGGQRAKLLSRDAGSGAASLILDYPAGWTTGTADTQFHFDVDEEFFVLYGELTLNGVRYGQYSYAHLPAGFSRSQMESPQGAVVLTFFAAEPRFKEGPAGAGSFDEARLVRYVDGFVGEWTANFHPQFPPGAGRKFLRRDPHDGEETWLLGTMPLRSGRRPERHPVVEEMYLLSGELVGPLGVMQAGCYFWRPPEEWHGPFGSPTGNLMLFRTKGGPLSTVYTDHEVEFTWTPEHQPILPKELAGYGRVDQTRCLCF